MVALGIVYGDLGTSPLYTLQTVVHTVGGHFTAESALGVLSLIVWTLIVTVSVKYCLLVMRADNHGEGGILALMSLVGANSLKGRGRLITAMGLLGAALLYGHGVITPSISVLSAIEGVNVVTTAFKPYVMPAAVAVLVALFAAQRFGAAKIGDGFGPIMLIWFVVIAALGLTIIAAHPGWPWVDEMTAVVLHKGNVYWELSGWAPKYLPESLKKDIRGRLRDKVMFGSDYPSMAYERIAREWGELDYPDDVMEGLFHKNAERVLGFER